MNELHIPESEARRLLAAANGDAALLYIYLRCGNDPVAAGTALHMSEQRCACAPTTASKTPRP